MKLFRIIQGLYGEIHCDCYVAAENYEAAKCEKNWFCKGYEIKEVKDRKGQKYRIRLELFTDEDKTKKV